MACSSCQQPSSKVAPLEASLRDFTSFLGSSVSMHSSERSENIPKTRLDLLSAHDDTSTYTLPSLSMFPAANKCSGRNVPPSPTLIPCGSKKSSASGSAIAQQTAIYNLSHPVRYSRSEVEEAPERLARNICSSFTSLIEANLRQYFKIHVLRQSRDNVCSADSAQRLAKSFFQEHGRYGSIVLENTDVSFSVPASKNSAHSKNECANQSETKLQLVIRIVFKMSISGKIVSVPVEGHGSITGYSEPKDEASIDHIDISLDTPHLLLALREKARLAAWKAITASSAPMPTASESYKASPAARPRRQTQPRSLPVVRCPITPSSSPVSAPKKACIVPADSFNFSGEPLKRNLEPSESLSSRKRRCVRNSSSDAQSPLDILTGLAVLRSLKENGGK